MTNRTYLTCETCDHPITARVLIGHNPNPIYTFPCPNCSQDIRLGLEIDQQNVSIRYLYLSNCRQGTSEGTIVNLSAEIAINRRRLHSDHYLPALFVDRELFGTKKGKTPVLPQLISNWKVLRKAWSLSLKGKGKIAERFIKQYRYFFDDPFDPDLNSQIYNFALFFLVPSKYPKVIPVYELLKTIQKTNLRQYVQFLSYWASEYATRFSKRYLDLFISFMANFDTLYPILMYYRIDKEVDPETVPPSLNFNNVKMFYGNTFELLADAFVVPFCINNLAAGRNYDQFETMDLAKYHSIDKANRANPFMANHVLSFLAEEFQSSVRNASHHGSIELSEGGDEVIYYHGKPSKEDRMSVTDYLSASSRAFINALCLLQVGLFLVEHEKRFSKQIGA